MEASTVLAKTPAGLEALSQRDADLPRTLRHSLILVDGKSSRAELEAKGSIIPDFAGALDELIARGLIAPRGESGQAPTAGAAAAPLGDEALKGALTEVAARLLGDRSAKVLRKLEEAGDSRDAMVAARDACYKLIRLTIDEKLAEDFRRETGTLIGG